MMLMMKNVCALEPQTDSKHFKTEFSSLPISQARKATWDITAVFVQVADPNFKKVEFNFLETRPDHVHTPALGRPHLTSTDLRNAAHTVAVPFHNKPGNTSLSWHHMLCAHGQHDYCKAKDSHLLS